MLVANEGAGVAIYHNNNEKLAIVRTGINVTGAITASGNISSSGKLLGGDDLVITDGTRTLTYDVSAGDLQHGGATFHINKSNGVDTSFDNGTLYVDASANRVSIGAGTAPTKTLEVEGSISSSDHQFMVNNKSLKWPYNGVDSTIRGESGQLKYTTSHGDHIFRSGSTNLVTFDASTQRVGIGNATAPYAGLHISGSTGATSGIRQSRAGSKIWTQEIDSSGRLQWGFRSTEGGSKTTTVTFDDSTNYVGIGTATPNEQLEVSGSLLVSGPKGHITASGNISSSGTGIFSEINLADGKRIKLGTGDDLQLYHDGNHSYITNGTGDLYINSDSIEIQASNGENYLKGTANGAVQLYHNGNQKLATTATGIDVTGNINATSLNVTSITSSIVTSSILQTEGSNIFGDTISDTHTFNGHITASGNISSSGTGTNFLSGNLKFKGSRTISTVGGSDHLTINPDAQLNLGTGGVDEINIGRQSGTADINIFANTSTVAARFLSSTITFNHPITASGDISSSGTIQSTGNISTNGSITATSADINGNVDIDGGNLTVGTALQLTNGGVFNFGGSLADGRITWDTGYASLYGLAGNKLRLGSYNQQGVLTISSSTENVMVISASNVGIGTTSPERALEIKDTSNNHQLQLTAATNMNSGIKFTDGTDADAAHIYYYHTDKRLRFYTDNTEQMNILANGNVGIGTTSPTELLQVAGIISASGGISSSGTLHISPDVDSVIELGRAKFGPWTSDYMYLSHHDMASNVNYALNQTSAGVTSLNAASGRSIQFKISNDEKMTLASDGNVGIGTTSPANLLHISSSNGDGIRLGVSPRMTITEETDKFLFQVAGTGYSTKPIQIGRADGNHDVSIYADNIILSGSTGKVGINTKAPPKTLTVQGDISASGDFYVQSTKKIYFGTGDNTYIQESSNDVLKFFAGGAQMLVLDDGNKSYFSGSGTNFVGIGTANPTKPLQVFGDISASGTATVQNLNVFGPASGQPQIYINDRDNGLGTGDGFLITKSGTNCIYIQ